MGTSVTPTDTDHADRPRTRDRTGHDLPAGLRRARAVAHALDAKFTIPGTRIRFGYDALVGLIPGVGDTATTLVGAWIFLEARRAGVRKAALARMALNLFVDWLIGLVPILDLVFDVAYKANLRNVRIFEREVAS